MVVTGEFPEPQLNATLGMFVQMLADFFGPRLLGVLLYGSIVFDDLAVGYGDLDFLAVIDGDLSSDDCRRLVELRAPLRGGESGIYAQMLEGAFLPRRMLDPAEKGSAFWWGTSGERSWDSNELGPLALRVIRQFGMVIYGQDIRGQIHEVSDESIFEELRAFAAAGRNCAPPFKLHSIDWLLTTARLLLWLKEGKLSSKSEAADWGVRRASGEWRKLLPDAALLRLSPAEADSPGWRRWLGALGAHIEDALDELERELAARGFRRRKP